MCDGDIGGVLIGCKTEREGMSKKRKTAGRRMNRKKVGKQENRRLLL